MEITGYDESGKSITVGAKKPLNEKNGAIMLLLYYYDNVAGEWKPWSGE